MALLLGLALVAATLVRADVASPNDPNFASCEQQDSVTGCKDREQWNLFGPLPGNTCPAPVTEQPILPHPDGGLPCWAPLATDPQHAAGVNAVGAWDLGNVGRPDVLIAYIEGGVNYSSDGIKDALDHIFLNEGELPVPEHTDGSPCAAHDCDGDGRLSIRDYAQDPRVNPPCAVGSAPFSFHQEGVTWSCVPGGQHAYLHAVHVAGKLTPYLSPEDLIAVFSNGVDDDANGYIDDISGWNFERNTNDPQTEDFDYGHASGLMSNLVGVADNGFAGVGTCRDCSVVPIKSDAEPLGRSDRWGASILYATDLGVSVISSVVVEYSYSRFSQAAVDYAHRHGVVVVLDSNDFDSMDHTDGMFLAHAIPGNSLTIDQKGGPDTNATTWFRARSDVTSYGTHALFSTGGTSTSGSTPFTAGVAAMVVSAGLNAGHRLTADEVKQTLLNSASAVIPQIQSPQTPRQWPGNPDSGTDATHTNWSTQYGYGRPDLASATQLLRSGKVPPTAEIDAPAWFAYVDPVAQATLEVDGSLAPSRFGSAGAAHYVLEWALGANPADSDFHTVGSDTVTDPLAGRLGTIDLSQIPRSFSEHPPGDTLQPDGPEQYTMTIRLRVWDDNGLKAEDRRSVGLRHDPTLSFARHLGGEFGLDPTYADLEGRAELDLIVASADGRLDALRPDGTEVPGFPVFSDQDRRIDPRNPENYPAPAYRIASLREVRDPLSGVAVGDLFHDGRLEVVADSTNGDLYVWDAQGRRLPGFPVHTDPRFWSLPVPTPRAPFHHSRLPQRGAWFPPVLADLEGSGRLDLLMSAFDGHVYAWRPDGAPVPGWPVEVKLGDADFARLGVDPGAYIRDAKLMYSVGVADVLGTGRPQVFVSSFECDGQSTSTEDLAKVLLGLDPGAEVAKSFLYGLWSDGNDHAGGPDLPGWPVALPGAAFCYDQSIDFVGEGTSPPVIGRFGGIPRVVSAAVTGTPELLNADGSVALKLSTVCDASACAPEAPYRSGDSNTITLTGQVSLGQLSGSGDPQVIQSSAGVETLLAFNEFPGQAALPQVYEQAWDPASGLPLAGFPQRQDGFPFYEAAVTADVGGGGVRQAIEGNDNYWVHAFAADGLDNAPGFPKYTGQWQLGGTVGDARMDGQLHYATVSREGWIFDWRVGGDTARNDSWWHVRHDERNTGDYGLDTRRPAAILDLAVARTDGGSLRLTWTAPGDDYRVGTADHFVVRLDGEPVAGAPPPGPAGTRETMTIADAPAGRPVISVQAVDDAGNLGALGTVVRVPAQ